jgi:hypothetical protein
MASKLSNEPFSLTKPSFAHPSQLDFEFSEIYVHTLIEGRGVLVVAVTKPREPVLKEPLLIGS